MRVFMFSLFMLVTLLLIGNKSVFPAGGDIKKTEMKKLLPSEVEGYQADGKDQFYDRQTSFQYMDGAAELYRAYAFKLLLVRRYLKADHPPMIVELFDMGSPGDAFGIFSYDTEGEEVGVGQGSDYGGGLLRFWKGRFFANVFAEKETPSTKTDVLEIGKALANAIGSEAPKPKLLNTLPKGDQIERRTRFFHHPLILNHHYFVSHQNILNLGKGTDAVLAAYSLPEGKGKTFLLLIRYLGPNRAEKAFKSFLSAYMPEAASLKTVKTENGKWTSARSHRQYILIIFDAPTQDKADGLIGATLKKLEKK